jgi:hypothetical protein
MLRDKELVLRKAADLLGYRNFLTQARGWKAARKEISSAFEREVQAQATQALSDGRDLVAATLRTTKHLKQTGTLDRALDSWIAAVHASGPVRLQDLWSDLVGKPEPRRLLRDQGLTDDLFAAMNEHMQKLDGRLVLQGGKLAAEVEMRAEARPRRLVLTHSTSGPPRNLGELLSTGQFERMVEQFVQGGPLSFEVVPGQRPEVEIAHVVSAGALLGVQSLAQHKRKLEDTGLAVAAGNDLVTALILAEIVVFSVGAWLVATSCGPDPPRNDDLCTLGVILLELGVIAMFIAVPFLEEGLGLLLAGSGWAVFVQGYILIPSREPQHHH